MGFPGAHNVRQRPQGLGVAREVSTPRIGDLASPTEHRTRRQNGARRSPDTSAERHVWSDRCCPPPGMMRECSRQRATTEPRATLDCPPSDPEVPQHSAAQCLVCCVRARSWAAIPSSDGQITYRPVCQGRRGLTGQTLSDGGWVLLNSHLAILVPGVVATGSTAQARTVGSDVDSVAATPIAEAPRVVLRQVYQHIRAVSSSTDTETVELFGADHVDERHGCIDSDAIGQRRLGRGGVDVVIPLIVSHQLWKGIRPTEKIVHDVDSPGFVGLPHRTQAVAQSMNGVKLTLVPASASGPAPEHDERIEIGRCNQLLDPVAAAVDERRRRNQSIFRVMGKKQLDSFQGPQYRNWQLQLYS